MFEKELKYFIDHQKELVKKYKNKYIVIVDNGIVGIYENIDQAYNESLKKMQPGTFFIQQCIPGEAAYSQTFNSRVIFA